MVQTGVNIYLFSDTEQRRLLTHGLRRWAVLARRRGLAHGVWFTLFDARGPHVFVTFSTEEDKQLELQAFLGVEIRDFCAHYSSADALTAAEIEQRHRECRGRALCDLDRWDGLALNNSFAFFAPDSLSYPLWLSQGIADVAEFWRQMNALALRNLKQLTIGKLQAAAVRWLISIDGAVTSLGIPAELFWRLYASSLILPLGGSSDTRHELCGKLHQAIGRRNRTVLDGLWNRAPERYPGECDPAALVKLIFSAEGRSLEQRCHAVRELTHSVLSQLFQPADLRIPMVLYAWQRSLSR